MKRGTGMVLWKQTFERCITISFDQKKKKGGGEN